MKIKIINSVNGKTLVEYIRDGIAVRCAFPSELVVNDSVDDSLLSIAIPHGVDWAFALSGVIRSVGEHEIAAVLSNAGIFTLEDVKKDPQRVVGAIQSAYGIDYATIVRVAEAYMSYFKEVRQ